MFENIVKIGFGAVSLLMGYDIVRRHQKNKHEEAMLENDNRVLDAISRLERRVDEATTKKDEKKDDKDNNN